jgi:acyl homoserine lactone synthase
VIIHVEPRDRHRFGRELTEYYRLRKRVFCDQLNWVPAGSDGLEKDHLDALDNVVILSLDPETGSVAGGVRLMPTTGPTLMHSVWADMLPKPDAYRSPGIWEATRFCVDDSSGRSRKRSFVNRATLALSLAVLEFCDANGISRVIGVCEKKFFDMQRVYGTSADIISSKVDQNGTEIGCGLWDTGTQARASLQWARIFLGEPKAPVLPKVA